MNRRIAAVVFVLTALYACSVAAAERFRPLHGGDAVYGHYLVTLAADVPEADVASLASALAKAFGGRLEAYAAAGFHGFAVVMRPAAAQLLSGDARVLLVEEQPTSERVPKQTASPSSLVRVPASGSAAGAPPPAPPIPFRAASESSSTEPWSGTYVYDGSGNIKAIGENVYRYDGVHRLVSATAITKAQGGTQTYQYDGFGNVLQVTVNDGSTPPAVSNVDSSTNRIDSTAPCPSGAVCSFGTFDEAGNQTGANDPLTSPTAILATYTYDSQNMMTDRQEGSRHDIYVYDTDDERIATVNYGSGGGSQTWHYTLRDAGANVIREVDATVTNGAASYSWKQDYVHRGGLLLAAVTPQARTHFHLDHLGTTRLITDDAGAKLALHTYWPFGTEAAGSDYDTEARRFTGHERDDFGVNEAGTLDYMHARYYRGAVGRFTSVDKVAGNLKRPQTGNRYVYTAGNPAKYVDPNGMYFVLTSEADREFFAHAISNGTAHTAAREVFLQLARDPNLAIYLTRSAITAKAPTAGETFMLPFPNAPHYTGANITMDTSQYSRPNAPSFWNPTITIFHELWHVFDFAYMGGFLYKTFGDVTDPNTDTYSVFDILGLRADVYKYDAEHALSADDVSSYLQGPDENFGLLASMQSISPWETTPDLGSLVNGNNGWIDGVYVGTNNGVPVN